MISFIILFQDDLFYCVAPYIVGNSGVMALRGIDIFVPEIIRYDVNIARFAV